MNIGKKLLLSLVIILSSSFIFGMGDFDIFPNEIKEEILTYFFLNPDLKSLEIKELNKILNLTRVSKEFKIFLDSDRYQVLLDFIKKIIKEKKYNLGIELLDLMKKCYPIEKSKWQNAQYKVLELINVGADLSVKSTQSEGVIHAMCLTGDEELAKLLIEKYLELYGKDSLKVNLGMQDNSGDTAFAWACSLGLNNIVQLLFDNGANINHKNKRGETPIMQIVSSTYLKETILLLIKLGADLNLTDNKGQTVLDFVNSKKIRDIIQEL